MAPPTPPAGPWAHLRTAFVVFHLAAITAMALPAPAGGMSRSAWRDPAVQAEFAVWHRWLSGLGYDGDAKAFEADLWAFATGFMSVRTTVLTPLRPYLLYTGSWQSWRMFVAPHTVPSRLHIDVRTEADGAWMPIYAGRSDTLTWNRQLFDHDRMRSATFRHAWPTYRRAYDHFVDWVADQVGEEMPEAVEVRVRFHKVRSPTPEQVRTDDLPPGRWVLVRTRPIERAP